MKELIGDIAKSLVDKPEEVSVTEIEGNNINVLELSVAKSDNRNMDWQDTQSITIGGTSYIYS